MNKNDPYRIELRKSEKTGKYTPWLKIPGVPMYPLKGDDGRSKQYATPDKAFDVAYVVYLDHLNHYHHKLCSKQTKSDDARARAEKLFGGLNNG